MNHVQELKRQRAQIWDAGQKLVEKIRAESRAFTAEEQTNWDKVHADMAALKSRIEIEERADAMTAEFAAAPSVATLAPSIQGEEARAIETRALRKWLRNEQPDAVESRALETGNGPAGGYLIAPQVFVDELIKKVDNLLHIRGKARIFQVPNAESLGVPALDTRAASPDWTSELSTGSADSTLAFGKRELRPQPLARRILVSKKFLRQVTNADGIVSDEFAYQLANTMENAYQNGTGANQPLGVFTASAMGVPTSQDVSTNNTGTTWEADNAIAVKYALKPQYRANPACAWLMHSDSVAVAAKWKGGDGQYLWRMGMAENEPDRLLGIPIMESLLAPNTFTTGLYVGILGCWSHYYIADSLAITMQRLVELYAATNQDGFIFRYEGDGMPVLGEAFVRVKLA